MVQSASAWVIVPPLLCSLGVTYFSYKDDPEAWHWRLFQASIIAMAGAAMVCHPVTGVIGALMGFVVPLAYFKLKKKKQFSLLDMMLYVLFVGSLGAGAATRF